ncbi:cation-dependent mannose-6-phosphate receptor isoform X2 [Notechis scutatus]|uniref:Cation-dependent mannose-6-phosphate receptor n=1 Tax=Notechis scutatus TaxID=8663 RepID=A0A6J1US11_9SAUR|nr:cation-dependent mannose-6-phosphate receptor isoform X2 [Notechis scutatus]
MFLVHAFSHAVTLAIIITVMAEEKTCDLLGEREQESSKEVALMNRLKPLFNQSFETESKNGDGQYIYRLRICREVFSNMTNSGLVQISKIDNKQKVIGRINETHLANGTSWILLIYQGGDPYGSHCTQEDRKALVMIICNRTTLATGFTMVAEEREKIKQCSYVFELESSLACPLEELHHNVHRHLSIGSILLITPTQIAKAEEAGEEMAVSRHVLLPTGSGLRLLKWDRPTGGQGSRGKMTKSAGGTAEYSSIFISAMLYSSSPQPFWH